MSRVLADSGFVVEERKRGGRMRMKKGKRENWRGSGERMKEENA